jgi:hypothetical protein
MENKKILKKNFSENLLKKLKKDDIKQIPKAVFICKHISVWLFLTLSVLL